ncbi:Protein SCAR2 [Quillaja saponaria]|uniref:Protein SCAR n=1 Tax=Quillaja saponaria TaxID=32244 RepID=A0AAD7PCI0_QUISA|nr:Protein SCAR2 [Quillaja saponaria]
MPLTRYQLRNEYSLADRELYRAADKDDPEALLEGVAMAGLAGVLRQLGDLAEFAAEIFHDLHEEVMTTAARGHGLMARIQQLEAEVPSLEKAFLSQTNHSPFFSNGGIDWHPNLRSQQNLITLGDLPRFIMDSYEECQGPPQLFLLDKFDVAGAWEKRTRRLKKKGARGRNGETPEIVPAHAKLHQLFEEERIEKGYSDPARLVKLKRKQLNGSVVDSKTVKSYMEKFLESPSPDHKVVCETSVTPEPLKLISDDTSVTGDKILEISKVGPVKESSGHGSTSSSPNRQEVMREPSSNMSEEIDVDTVKEHEPSAGGNTGEISYNPHGVMIEKEISVDEQKHIEGSVDGYQSDDVTSEVDNYVDALASMDSEMETDNESRTRNNLLNIRKQGIDSDGNEELLESQAQFSDSQSIGNSSASDENSLFKKDRSSFSYSDTLSSWTENTPSDGDGAAKLLPSTESCLAEIGDIPSNQLSVVFESCKTECHEFVVPDNELIREEKTPDVRQAPCSSCLTNSTPTLVQSDLGEPSSLSQSVGPELDETYDNKCHSILTESNEDRTYLVESTDAVSDALSLIRDEAHSTVSSEIQPVSKVDNGVPYVNSDVLLQFSSDSESATDKKCSNSEMLQSESAGEISSEIMMSQTKGLPEKHIICTAFQEVDSHLSTTLPPDGLSSKSDILETYKLFSEANNCIIASDLNLEDLSLSMDSPLTHDSDLCLMVDASKTGGFTEKNLSVSTHASPQVEPDSSGVDNLNSDGQSDVEEFSRMMNGDETATSACSLNVVRGDTPLEHESPPDYPQQENHGMLNDVVSDTVQAEDEVVSAVTAVDSAEDDINKVTCPASVLVSSAPRTSLQESPSEFPDTQQKEIESNEEGAMECLKEPEAQKEVDQLKSTSDIISSPMKDLTSIQESHSRSADSHEVAPEFHADEEENRLKVPSADLQSILNGSVYCDPFFVDKHGVVHDLSFAKQTQNSHSPRNVTTAPDFSAVNDQEPESKSLCQSGFFQNGEDLASLPCYSQPEAETPLEKSLQLQDGKDSISTELPYEQIQSPNDLVQERRSVAASESCSEYLIDQPSPSESLPQSSVLEVDHINQVINPLEPFLPSLLPEAINIEEMPPMPPLPPMQWRMGKFQNASLASHADLVEVSPTVLSPIQPSKTEDKTPIVVSSSERAILEPQNPFLVGMDVKGENQQHAFGFLGGGLGNSAAVPISLQLPTVVSDANGQYNYLGLGGTQTQNPFLAFPVVSTERLLYGCLAPEGDVVQYPNSCSPMLPVDSTTLGPDSVPSQETLVPPSIDLVVGTGSEVKVLQHISPNLEGEQGNNSATSIAAPGMEHLQHGHNLPPSEGGIARSSETSALTQSPEGGKPNGNPSSKVPRPRNPLIDAVVAHDKSKLRKVAERVRPQIEPKVDERDSLLEQIRTKSFNLKSAALTRPSIQGPKTNLKVAAILEKANAIRQALAGSDEDDDVDAWSDS